VRSVRRPLQGSPFRTFLLYPAIVVGWELFLNEGRLRLAPWYLPLLAWGFLQYYLVGRYRVRLGGGGPGMENPPERLVVSGPFAWSRNPMYLGHIIFLLGLTLSLRSGLAALITAATAAWFQFRVQRDEKRLRERFGQPYADYSGRVKRWIPFLF
jgi:protein-S-isoprenylcysteine O-methyltransferase Ste14